MTPDLRYPIGTFDYSAPITSGQRAANIADLEALPRLIRAAVAELTAKQLDTPYRPGGWTVRQLVHHVADSHLNGYARPRFALTEDNPTIKPYIEGKWAELADAKALPLEPSLQILDGVHARWAALLRSLGDADFTRSIVHPEHGRTLTIDILTGSYAWHSRHHVRHITALREREGW
jgi:hypothetical protein